MRRENTRTSEQVQGQQQTEAVPNPTAWGQPISEARQTELQGILDTWNAPDTAHGEKRSPFDGVRLTGAEVFWLAVCVLADQREITRDEVAQHLRPSDRELGLVLNMSKLSLQGADLDGAQLQGANLGWAQLQGAHLIMAQLQGAHLYGARLQGAHLIMAQLQGANLDGAQLQGAHLDGAQLQGTYLYGAQLQGTYLRGAQLQGANLREAYVNVDTRLAGATLCAHDSSLRWRLLHPGAAHLAPTLGDVRWGGVGTVDLTQITDWDTVDRLGDERGVRWRDKVEKHQAVVRAYRQMATQLRAQGMTEVADRLSHRALSYERRVFLRQANIPRYFGSWFLAILAGYGYRPLYTIFWYLVVVFGCAFAYWHFGPSEGMPFSPLGALVLSVTSFHGRGFLPGGSPGHTLTLDDPITVLAAAEAVIGLLIEISFIATFTQRFFGSK